MAPRPTRSERRHQRQYRYPPRPRPADPGVFIGAGLMIVGGVVVLAAVSPVVLSASVSSQHDDFSSTGSVALAAGVVTLGIGAIVLVSSLAHRHRRYAWLGTSPPLAASSALSPVLLRF